MTDQSYGWDDAQRDIVASYESFERSREEAATVAAIADADKAKRAAMRTWVAAEVHRAVAEFCEVVRRYSWQPQQIPYAIPGGGEIHEGWRTDRHIVISFQALHFWVVSNGLWGFDEKGGSDYDYPDYWTRFGFKLHGDEHEFVWNALADDPQTVAGAKRHLAAWLLAKGLPLPS